MERVLAVLGGLPGVIRAERDSDPKTVRILYDSAQIAPAELVRRIDGADIRLQAHHRFTDWLKLKYRKQNTARILSDRAV